MINPLESPEIVWLVIGVLIGFVGATMRAARRIDKLLDVIYWLSFPR